MLPIDRVDIGPAQPRARGARATCARKPSALWDTVPSDSGGVTVQPKPLSALAGEPRVQLRQSVRPGRGDRPGSQRPGMPGGLGARRPARLAKQALPFMSRNEAPAAPGRATGGGLPVACRTAAESSAEKTESSHLGRRPCAVLLQEAVTEKVRRRPGGEAGARGARVLPGCHGAAAPARLRCARGTKAALGGGGIQAAARPRLSHPRSETRLRRPLRSPTRAVPHLAGGPRCAFPRPLLPATSGLYVTREEGPAWIAGGFLT